MAEWVNDWYSETYYQHSPVDNPQGPTAGVMTAMNSDPFTIKSNPPGPTAAVTKAIRGGSYCSFPGNSRQTFRDRLEPGDNRFHDIGIPVRPGHSSHNVGLPHLGQTGFLRGEVVYVHLISLGYLGRS